MSDSRPPPLPTEPAYPPDNPWRVAWRLMTFADKPDVRFWVIAFSAVGVFVSFAIWSYFIPGWMGDFATVMFCSTTLGLLIGMYRYRDLRAALMSHQGGELGESLHYHPIAIGLALLGPAALVALSALFYFTATQRAPLALGVSAGTVIAAFAAVLGLSRLSAGRMDASGISLRPLFSRGHLLYSEVTRLDWHPAGGTGPDRLTVITPSATAHFLGQYDRNNDVVYRVLDGVIGPRLAAAQAELERDGKAVLGPLWIYRDRFERPADEPPVRVPFSLAKSAAINRTGRFVVEIPGRHEPLPLLAPAEYPFVPVALRLTGVLWRAGEIAEGEEPETGMGGPPEDPGAELAN